MPACARRWRRAESGARVLVLEAAPFDERGGNSRYTAGALRFVYNGVDDLLKLCDLSARPSSRPAISAPTRRTNITTISAG